MYCLAFTGWAAVCCWGVTPGWDRKDICGAPEQRPQGRATPREAGAGGGSSSVGRDPHSPGHCRCPSWRPFSLTHLGLSDFARLLTVPRHVLGDKVGFVLDVTCSHWPWSSWLWRALNLPPLPTTQPRASRSRLVESFPSVLANILWLSTISNAVLFISMWNHLNVRP